MVLRSNAKGLVPAAHVHSNARIIIATRERCRNRNGLSQNIRLFKCAASCANKAGNTALQTCVFSGNVNFQVPLICGTIFSDMNFVTKMQTECFLVRQQMPFFISGAQDKTDFSRSESFCHVLSFIVQRCPLKCIACSFK